MSEKIKCNEIKQIRSCNLYCSIYMYTQKISDTYEHSVIVACRKHSNLLGYETFLSLVICTHQQFLTPHEHSMIALGEKKSNVMRHESSHLLYS